MELIDQSRRRTLAVIGAASSAGAYGTGQEQAPEAFRRHGLMPALESVRKVSDHGGDCTIEIGVVAAALDHSDSVGLIYVDLDADLTTTRTSDGILDWTGVAHLLDVDDTHPDLAGLGPRRALLRPDDVVLIGLDRASDPEQQLIEALDIAVEPLAAVRTDLTGVLERTASWATRHEIVLVHVDADVLCWDDLAIADNTRRVDGLTVDELQRLLTGLMSLPEIRVLTLCEVNPDHASDEAEAMTRLIELVVSGVGGSNPPSA